MIIETKEQLIKLQEIGKICAEVRETMIEAAKPGITTRELDDLAGQLFRKYGAVSAPISVYNFPGETCISVNDEIAHGIPGNRILMPGDMVNIDVSASLDGVFADTARSFFIGEGDKAGQHILKTCHKALENAINAAVAGRRINVIGKAVEATARKAGCKLIRNLCGHGVGNTIHDDPEMINNYYDPLDRRKLQKGLVLALEPFIAEKEEYVIEDENDGWTLHTPMHTRAAQCEHTIVVTEGKPIIITTLD